MNQDEIIRELKAFLYESYPTARQYGELPLDKSLYETGILDSFGIVELVAFVEKRWLIHIEDREITKEKFGGILRMAELIGEKTCK